MQRDNSSRLGRGGFTLVELAVALLIGSILITAVFQMMSGQARFSAVQSGREETQQNTRGALEILSSELRSAAPQMILDAGPQTVTFMQPRAWGLLCSGAGTTQINVVLPNVGADAAWAVSPANGVLVRTGPGTYDPAPANGVAGRAHIVTSQDLGAPTNANCPNMNPSGNLKVIGLGLSRAVAGTAGDPVALYTLTRYDVAAVNGVSWLRRNSSVDAAGNFNAQPLAGPLVTDRFHLEYRGVTGAVVPNPSATPENIAQVRVRVVTESSQRLNDRVQRDSGETVVTLRNTN